MAEKLNAKEMEALRLELELRAREEREQLSDRYDWYGDECGCKGRPADPRTGVPVCGVHERVEDCDCPRELGECRDHHRARPYQRPPGTDRASSDVPEWKIWMCEGGRGSGKTWPASIYITSEAMKYPGMWIGLIAETVGEVRRVMIEHPTSGLLNVAPPWFQPTYLPSLAEIRWPNGSFGSIFSAEEPDALRGPEFSRAWLDDFSKWRYGQAEVYNNLKMCLRAMAKPGMPSPRAVISTTPKPSPTYKLIREHRRTIVTGGPTRANFAHLDPDFIADVYSDYEGTRLGAQELEGVLLEDVPGALWAWSWLERDRIPAMPEGVAMEEVAVAIDPGVGSENPDSAAEAGIMVGCRGSDGLGYLLHDGTTKGSPFVWVGAAVGLYHGWNADWIIGEINNGGQLVEMALRSVDDKVSYKAVTASRGKQTRAQPIASLSEQGRIRHVGNSTRFLDLERQLTTWLPGDKSPDRLDAYVWLFSHLMLGRVASGGAIAGGDRAAFRQIGRPQVSTSRGGKSAARPLRRTNPVSGFRPLW